ncbi:MAG: MFS transporter [Pseudomonadota bacterium]
MADALTTQPDDSTEMQIQAVSLDEVVTTVVMARVTDFFGFFVYAIASALVFPTIFFPFLDPVQGTMAAFALFALAFIVRPFASMAGRKLQKKIGKIGKISGALFLLGTATVAIGLLPGYEQIGWLAPALLAGLRILQGIGLGGAWDGITLQLQNAAPKHRKGLYAMVPQLGGPIGFIVAGSLFYVLTGFLTPDEFMNYGWRFAFFAVLAVNIVSLFARLRLLQTDFGADPHTFKSAPFVEMVRTQWRPVVLSTMMPLASYALFHMVTVFPLAYATLYTPEIAIDYILLLQFIGGVIAAFTVVLSGVLADRYHKRSVLWTSIALIPLLCLTLPSLDTNPALYILFGFAVLGLAYGQASAIVPNRYPPRFRYSGTALSTNLSWIVGAAFAPLVGLTLTAWFGIWAMALYLLSGVAVTAVALVLLGRIKKHEVSSA